MDWELLGNFTLTEEWQLTTLIKAELFRVTHLSVPIKQDYVKAVIAQGFKDDEIVSVFTPQRLSCRQEKEIFSFSSSISLDKRILFRRLDKANDIIWKIKIEFKSMLIPSNKLRSTIAQSLPDVTVSNVKTIILREKTDSSRQNYLLTNNGSQSVFFKYVPLGVDPASDTLLISPTNWDFFIEGGRQWFDQTYSQNGLIAIASNANQAVRIKAIEYNYL